MDALLILIAFACFVLAALNVPRANWLAVGLAFFSLGHTWTWLSINVR